MSEIAEDVSVSMYQQSTLTAGNVMPVRVRILHHMSICHILILHPSACESSSIAQMTVHETRPKTPNLKIYNLCQLKHQPEEAKKKWEIREAFAVTVFSWQYNTISVKRELMTLCPREWLHHLSGSASAGEIVTPPPGMVASLNTLVRGYSLPHTTSIPSSFLCLGCSA